MGSFGSDWEVVVGHCEHGNESSCSNKAGKFLDQLPI